MIILSDIQNKVKITFTKLHFKNKYIRYACIFMFFCLVLLGFVFWYWIFGRPFYPLIPEKSGNYGKFTLATDYPYNFTEGGGVTCNNNLYVLCGINHFGSSRNLFFVYNESSKQWIRLQDFPVLINHPNITSYGNKIVVAGGFNPLRFGIRTGHFMFALWNPVNSVFEYDVINGEWSQLPSMPEPRGASGISVCDNNIYLAGGIDQNKKVSNSLFRYNIKERKWYTMPSMPTARDHLRMETLNYKIYAISGRKDDLRKNCNQMECFDVEKNEWTTKSPIPKGRGGLSSCTLNDKIYTFGGEYLYNSLSDVEEYNPITDTWTLIDSLPEPRHGICTGVINGKIHLVGGGLRSRISVSSIHRVYTLN